MSSRSAAVRIAATPSISSAAEKSIERMRAWACGLRRTLAVQHPGHLHVADVLGLAAQLLVGVLARPRDADLERPEALLDDHPGIPASSRAASRIER